MESRPSAAALLRPALALFVLAWLFGPTELRSAVPIWLPFLVLLGLEAHFLLSGLRPAPRRPPDRGPQAVDRERYGFDADSDDLLLVRRGDDEFWIPYTGQSDEEIEELVAEARAERERAAEEPVERPRLELRRFAGLAVVAVLALAVWLVETGTGWDGLDADDRAAAAERYSAEASRIAGKPVTIRCDESGRHVGAVQHADGVAIVGGDLAFLTPARCLDLYRIAFQGEAPSSRSARALAVLAHEAWHLRGVRDEGTTECYALQSAVELGTRLGLGEGTVRRLLRQQLAENSLRGAGTLEYRVPPDCRDGGRLDLDPSSSVFP